VTTPPSVADGNLPAKPGEERLSAPVVRTGMFGVQGTPDTSGYGGLRVHQPLPASSPRPYGGYFDAVADALGTALQADGTGFGDAVERVDPMLRFEVFSGVSGVHYPKEAGRELSVVYHLLSITHNRRIRLEVRLPDADPHVPSVTGTYPAANWHERETWDFFGVIFDGHPALTRIEMPDDWLGHPQRKDYPLGGIPVEYRGATVPPPDERRSYS
jgi:NADH-quinone oxidoreductase subunit C